MPELLGLTELKKRAKATGYTKSSRLADAESAMPPHSWDGVTSDAESGFAHADVSYVLNGNTVIVRKMGKTDIYYGLSHGLS
jgi:hypothetical protein